MNSGQYSDFSGMKNVIIYFSGTGNSLAVARLLAARMPQTTVISVNQLSQSSFFRFEVDACGFVFPVYCQDAPGIVRRLVRRISVPKSAYVFAIATHNGDPGYAHFSLDKILKKRGRRLSAGFAVLMPGNSITPFDSTNPEEEIQRRVREAKLRVDRIADDVSRRISARFEGSGSIRKRLKGLRNRMRFKVRFQVPKSFWVTDACDQCRVCVEICPEKNIRIDTNRPPFWGKECQMCLACIHWCPRRAIQNGQGTLTRMRYHHPDVSLDDMLGRSKS